MQTPTYDNFQVTPNTLPQTRYGTQEMGDTGAAVTQQAKVSMALGQHFGEQTLQQMVAANQAVADQKWVEVENYRLQLQQEYEQQRGLNALNREGGLSLADEYNNKLNQFIADRAESLNNRAQVEMFAHRVGPTQSDFSDGVTKHMMAEGRKFQEETLKGRLDVTISGAIAAPTEQAFATAIARLEGNIGDMAAYEGWAPERAQMELRNRVGEVVSQRANRLMDLGEYQQAQTMVEQYSQMMDGKTALDVSARVSKFQLDNISTQQADQLYEAFKNNMSVDGGGTGSQPTPPAGKAGGSGNVRTYTTQGGSFRKVGGSRAWRNNNEGNLEYGTFAKAHGAIGTDGRFAIFPTEEAGRRAKESLIFESDGGKRLRNNPMDYGEGIGYRNKTLTQMIAAYAPSSENNTRAYQQRVLAAVGGRNKQMRDYSPAERRAIMQSMREVEGWKEGRIEGDAGTAVVAQAGGGRSGRLQKGGGGQSAGSVVQPTVPVSRETRYAEYMRWIDENISNPVQREAVRRRFNERKEWDEKGANEELAKTKSWALDYVAANGTITGLPVSVQERLGPHEMRELQEYADKIRKGDEDRINEANELDYRDLRLYPEKMRSIGNGSEDDVKNYALPRFGPKRTEELVLKYRDYLQHGDASMPKLEQEMTLRAASMLGLNTSKTASPEDRRRFYLLQDNIINLQKVHHQMTGRYMTQAEWWEAIMKTSSDKIIEQHLVAGLDRSMLRGQLTPRMERVLGIDKPVQYETKEVAIPALLASPEEISKNTLRQGGK